MNRHFRRLLSLVAVTLLLVAAVPAVAVERAEESPAEPAFVGELQGWISVFWGWVKDLGFGTTSNPGTPPATTETGSGAEPDCDPNSGQVCEDDSTAESLPTFGNGG